MTSCRYKENRKNNHVINEVSNNVGASIMTISVLSIFSIKTWLLPSKADSGSSSLSELQTHLHYDNDAYGGDDADGAVGYDDGYLVW